MTQNIKEGLGPETISLTGKVLVVSSETALELITPPNLKSELALDQVTNHPQLKRADNDWVGYTEETEPDSDDFLLLEKVTSGAKRKVKISSLPAGGEGGEANTASNQGTGGRGLFHSKVGVDLQFKNINAGSSKVTISDDPANKEVDIDIVPGNIPHQNLSGAGTNSHPQIDSHLGNTSNPHSVTKTQVGLGNLTNDAQLKRADNDINSFIEKTSPASLDVLLIEDSGAGYAKKKVKIANLPGGGGGGEAGLKVLGESGYETLEAAITNIGSNPITLFIPAGTINITSDPFVPENIELLVLKGAIFNISADVTMTIAGPFRAGNNRHFDFGNSASKVVFNTSNIINVVWFTNGGDGSGSSPWTGADGQGGIGEAFNHTTVVDGMILDLPSGDYSITAQININRNATFIQGPVRGRTSSLGATAHLNFNPGSAQALFKFDKGDNSMIWQGGVSGVSGRNWSAYSCTFLEVVGGSEFTFRDIRISDWQGIGLYLRGQELMEFQNISIVYCDRPVVIGDSPGPQETIDADVYYFLHCFFLSVNETYPLVEVLGDVGIEYVTSLHFSECSFVGGHYCFYWNDTTSTIWSFMISFRNCKMEQASAPSTAKAIYIHHNSQGLKNLVIDNLISADHNGGFLDLANINNVNIRNVLYVTTGSGNFLTGSDLRNVKLETINTNQAVYLPGMTKALAVEGSTDEEAIMLAIYTADSTPTVTAYGL